MSGISILKQFGGFTKISVEKFIDWLKSNPKNIKKLSFQGEGKDNGKDFNHYIENFIKSANLEEIQCLNLNFCEISDGVIEALLEKSSTLIQLTTLALMGHKLSAKGIEALFQLQHLLKDKGQELNVTHVTYHSSYQCKAFYDFLENEYKNQSSNTVNADSVKKMIFDIARLDNAGNWVKYILEQSEKYPFLINSRNEQNETLLSFYTHSPAMQKFLFSHGLIPAKEPERTNESQDISQNKQSVHLENVSKRTRFAVKKLVEFLPASKDELEQAATSYMENISQFSQKYQKNQMKAGLLCLSENGKKLVMEKRKEKTALSDKAYIEEILKIGNQALQQKYLIKDNKGKYNEAISTIELQYDYTNDDAKITIPQSIGCVKLLIDRTSNTISRDERQELLTALAEQNPEIVKNKLSIIRRKLGKDNITKEQIITKTEFHRLLSGVNTEKVNELFQEISGFKIEEMWKIQKEFVLLEEIYEAATTYEGEYSNACTQGTWSHIINSINQIDEPLKAECDKYLQQEESQENQLNFITEGNITKFVEILARKLIQDYQDNSELGVNLINDFIIDVIDLDHPEEITPAQQKILAEINRKFTESIKEFLPNYTRDIPTFQEYKIIINELLKVNAIKDYAKTISIFSDDKHEQDEQLNLSSSMNSISGNQPNPTSSDLSISKGNEKLSETITKNQGSFGNIGSKSIEEKALLNMSASNNKQGIQSEVVLSESESEDDKSDITVILANTKKEKQFPTQPAEQADSIDRESKQLKPVTNEQDISTKDNSKSKPKENNVISQNKKMYILVTSALVVAGIVSGIAIAVYSGMLAVGIALGVCCLIAAAVIYYCNSPSNSLENSNTEVAMNQGQEL